MLKIAFCFLIVPVVNNFTVWRCCNRLNHLVAGATKDGRKKKHGDTSNFTSFSTLQKTLCSFLKNGSYPAQVSSCTSVCM